MNCPEIVEQATSGGFPWIILVALIVVAGVFVWKNGIVGTETSLKALADKLRTKANKIEAKWKAKVASAPVQGVLLQAPTKAERLAENKALLAAGTITQEQHDAAVVAILAA